MAVAKGAVALEAFTKIVQRTPVDTGLARGNWNLSIGAPDLSEQRAAPTGQAPIRRAKLVLAKTKTGAGEVRRITIHNGLPYINRLEHGWSKQAPSGMVKITLAELPEFGRRIMQVTWGQE